MAQRAEWIDRDASVADRRQPAERQREDHDEHDPGPEARDRHAEQRPHHGQEIDDRVALHGGDDTGREGDEQRDHGRARGEQQRGRELLDDEVAHGLLGAERAAEVAVRHSPEPAHVLVPERLVEAELAAERFACRAFGVLTEHGVDRVAGNEVDDREDDQRHEEEHRDGAEKAATEIRRDAPAHDGEYTGGRHGAVDPVCYM
jgi:hypothetical protein